MGKNHCDCFFQVQDDPFYEEALVPFVVSVTVVHTLYLCVCVLVYLRTCPCARLWLRVQCEACAGV
jgi:hypothetical protein